MRSAGESIDIWVVEKALGSGGMGSVYRCHNRSATRILAAVKVLDVNLAKAKGAEERFIREAEILFRIDHPNVVKVRNIRTDTDPPYLEMEFVEGESLESVLQRGPLPLGRALALFGQLVDAVGYLHALGIRHRDIKPQNLLVRPDGTLKLVDFGLAMEADASRITQQGTTFGTVSYAPPEWVNESLDPVKWDMYAVGVVGWEMLTGDVAFPVSGQGSARQQAMQVMLAKQNHAPLDPGEDFPDALRALIGDLTLSDANRRIGDAHEVIERLRGIAPRLDVVLRAPSGGGRREADTWVDITGKTRLPDGGLQAPPTPRPPPPLSQTMSLEPPPLAPRSRVGLWLSLALVAGLLVAGLGIGAVTLAAIALRPDAPRDVDVVLAGLPAGAPVAVTVDGRPPTTVDAAGAHFAALAVGAHVVAAAVGADCAPCLTGQACPVWCLLPPPAPVVVEAGSGRQSLTLPVTPIGPRSVPVTVVGPRAGVRLVIDRAELPLDADGHGTATLAPGRYRARLTTCAGDCPPDGCPAGCAETFSPIDVAATGAAEVGLVVPAAWAVAPATVGAAPPTAPAPKPKGAPDTPPAKANGSGAIVTNRDFAAWLGTHAAEWSKEAAIAAGRAQGSYLEGWTDTAPPPGKERAVALNISWYAADAFCRSRGGLANIDAEPLRWDDSQPPYYEWRQTQDGAPMFRGADGTQGLERSKKSTNSLTAFRCAR